VTASGVKGISEITLTLAESSGCTRRYTVRLHFAEPDGAEPGQRVFDVSLQGEPVLRAFDIAAAAGSPDSAVVKEFTGIAVDDKLTVTFSSSAAKPAVLCGVAVVAEGW
jgi:hypothetical protein